MNTYSREFLCMCTALGGVLMILACVLVRNLRDRRAAREAAKRDRLHRIAVMGFRSALMRGLVDERGNVISRVGFPEDVQ